MQEQKYFNNRNWHQIDTRFNFLPDLLAKSLNFTKKEGPKGQKPYTIEKVSSQRIFWVIEIFQKCMTL